MNFKMKLVMLCVILTLCMLIPVGAFAAEQTENSIKDSGKIYPNKTITYNFELKTKSNVVIAFYESSGAIYKLKIYDSDGNVVYTPPGYEGDEKTYDFCFARDVVCQHDTTLKKGKYKMTIKWLDPWKWGDDSFYDYSLSVKWAPTTEIMDELVVPDEPILKAVKKQNGEVHLSWNECKGADIYKLRISGNRTTYVETRETSYVHKADTNIQEYAYTVEAINIENAKNGISMSNGVNIVFPLKTPVVKTSNILSSGKIKLTWDKVSGASAYKVYRATSKDGKYTLLGTTTKNRYVNTAAKQGRTYYYRVKAIKKNFEVANSAYSKKVSAVYRLARPVVKASNVASSGKIKLTWKKIDGADKYVVYRSTSKNGEYKQLYTTSKTSFTNTGAKAEQLYFYKVKAIDADKDSASSAYSAVSSKRCDLKRPVVKVSSGTKAKLSWTNVAGAKEYKIYRAASKNGKYMAIKTVTTTKYTDKSAKNNKTYYYKVIAISGKSSAANSAYSKIVAK